MTQCGVYVFYGTGSDGFSIVEDGSGNDADGTLLDTCMFEFIGRDGVHGPFGDGTLIDVHTQNIGRNGFYISNATGYSGGNGGNIRLIGCRGDLSGFGGTGDGFFFNVSCGDYSGMIQAVHCSTQRNLNNGFHIAALLDRNVPRQPENCVAQGDGTDERSSAYRINGPASAHISEPRVPPEPQRRRRQRTTTRYYGITTATSAPGAAVLVNVIGGFSTPRPHGTTSLTHPPTVPSTGV